jgi:hypothetical protein
MDEEVCHHHLELAFVVAFGTELRFETGIVDGAWVRFAGSWRAWSATPAWWSTQPEKDRSQYGHTEHGESCGDPVAGALGRNARKIATGATLELVLNLGRRATGREHVSDVLAPLGRVLGGAIR